MVVSELDVDFHLKQFPNMESRIQFFHLQIAEKLHVYKIKTKSTNRQLYMAITPSPQDSRDRQAESSVQCGGHKNTRTTIGRRGHGRAGQQRRTAMGTRLCTKRERERELEKSWTEIVQVVNLFFPHLSCTLLSWRLSWRVYSIRTNRNNAFIRAGVLPRVQGGKGGLALQRVWRKGWEGRHPETTQRLKPWTDSPVNVSPFVFCTPLSWQLS